MKLTNIAIKFDKSYIRLLILSNIYECKRFATEKT